MPKWDDYKKDAKERGALALELYVVMTVPAGAPEAVKAALPAHLAYQRDLEISGQLVLAGPVSDDSGADMQGAGMIIYRAASMDAARALADADPMHRDKARHYTLRKWLVNEGSLNMSIGLSTGRIALA
ncbi:YciI family protein [Pseudoruegeria sp. SK021]|uniref:YciI family protein n=1 Tax=Pseudoruegeria sp. SK021 TaxID=1933035 RepID=UPI000A22EDB2|nr:YciI family protein [Pseudoruegeria sp. SK021]OSP54868.1 hypothetical protein BV911_10370 [Pseudoruegeria sp. SK021]